MLVDIVCEQSFNHGVVINLIKLSIELGVAVIVASHTLDEWERLWSGADCERPELLDHEFVPAHAERLALRSNPFVAQFIYEKTQSRSLTWAQFRASHRNVRPVLDRIGVTVRPTGNDKEEDRVLAERVKTALLENQRERGPSTRGERSRLPMQTRSRPQWSHGGDASTRRLHARPTSSARTI